ncbi:MAG: PspA-associated protein PspAA [Limnochordia bacterium]|jgi:hypothetical protein
MIIRIATEGQYELRGAALAELDDLDDAILAAIEQNQADQFQDALAKVVELIRTKGTRLPDASLQESDLILPPPDVSLNEARDMFTDYPQDLL